MRASRIIVLVVIVFALVLLARFPARWAAALLPDHVSCEDIAGTVWNGRCQSLALNGVTYADIDWRLQPTRLLTGRLSAHLTLSRVGATARGDVEITPAGSVTARSVTASLPLDPNVLPQLPGSWRGNVVATLPLLRLEGRTVIDLQGRIEIRDLREVGSNGVRYGDYVITFPEQSSAAGAPPVGQLRDLGNGPLAVEGTLQLTREPGYELNALIAPRQDAPPDLARQLQYLGIPDAQGRYLVSVAGTY